MIYLDDAIKTECAKALAPLNVAYSKEFRQDTYELYIEMLKDIPTPLLQGATIYLIKHHRFLPTIAEIRETAERLYNGIENKAVEDWTTAWSKVLQSASSHGYDRGLERLEGLTKRVAMKIGWHSICYASNNDVAILRAQFRDAYNIECNASKEKARLQAVTNSVPALKERQQQVQALVSQTVKQIGE